ncbi:MAG: hypothetical protein M1828_002914 [Chrysothrix sp. TS-e1954]|nr:MAG: hypothetical protein M1828_002914 [Chrysothrix sp. TS-e1954]
MATLAPYASLHASPNGKGDARPTALKIVEDQNLFGMLQDKVAMITGCSSGLGVETARALHMTGAKIFITARDVAKGEAIARDIDKGVSANRVELIEMDLASFDSVKAGAAKFLSKSNVLNILITNAGVMAAPEGRTIDGLETHFQTNHLSHFLLFQLLKETMLASSTPHSSSRVISISSSGHKASKIHFDNLNLDGAKNPSDPYHPWKAYAQSKTANAYFPNELDRRYGSRGIHASSVSPGAIETELTRHVRAMPGPAHETPPEQRRRYKSVEQGAAMQVWAAIGKELEGVGGLYLEDCQESTPFVVDGRPYALDDHPEIDENIMNALPYVMTEGYGAHVYDEEAEGRLWLESCRLVGVSASA